MPGRNRLRWIHGALGAALVGVTVVYLGGLLTGEWGLETAALFGLIMFLFCLWQNAGDDRELNQTQESDQQRRRQLLTRLASDLRQIEDRRHRRHDQ